MSDQHSPEPWRVGQSGDFLHCPILSQDGMIVADAQSASTRDGYQYGPSMTAQAGNNARRIVACVNALAGVPTEELETLLVAKPEWLERVVESVKGAAAAAKIHGFVLQAKADGRIP